MEANDTTVAPEKWRVVVFTNIPGGLIYQMVQAILRTLGHRVVGVVTTPGPKQRRSTSFLEVVEAVSPGTEVLVSNHPQNWAAHVAVWRPDLIVCGGMPWLIPNDVLALPRLGAINMHPSLLPRYRGPAPVEWAIRNGDDEFGFTVHRISNAFDTGAILSQVRIPLDDNDDFGTIMGKLLDVAPGAFMNALERVARGDSGEAQDESQASYAGLFEDEWKYIDWQQPARTIHNQVRSWTGFHGTPLGAIGQVDGEPLRITRTRLLPTTPDDRNARPAGTILHRTGDVMIVQCGDGPLEIVSWVRADVDARTESAIPAS